MNTYWAPTACQSVPSALGRQLCGSYSREERAVCHPAPASRPSSLLPWRVFPAMSGSGAGQHALDTRSYLPPKHPSLPPPWPAKPAFQRERLQRPALTFSESLQRAAVAGWTPANESRQKTRRGFSGTFPAAQTDAREEGLSSVSSNRDFYSVMWGGQTSCDTGNFRTRWGDKSREKPRAQALGRVPKPPAGL